MLILLDAAGIGAILRTPAQSDGDAKMNIN
jgi:hypothetical protein